MRILTEKYKRKIGGANSGNKHWNWTGGKNFIHYCKICNKEFKTYHLEKNRFCSVKCKSIWMSKNMIGKNHWNWKGGITSQPEYYNKQNLKYRHRMGISKLYRKQCNVSKTKEYRRLHRKLYKYNFKQAGKLTIQIIQQIYEDNIKRYGTLTCYLCLQPILFGKDHLEHKIPLSRGGNNKKKNLDISCQKCNNKKYNKTEVEYRKEFCKCLVY